MAFVKGRTIRVGKDYRTELREIVRDQSIRRAHFFAPSEGQALADQALFARAKKASRERGKDQLAADLGIPPEVAEDVLDEVRDAVAQDEPLCDKDSTEETWTLFLYLVLASIVAAAAWYALNNWQW